MLDIIHVLPADSDGNLQPMLLPVDKFFNSFQLIDRCSLKSNPNIGILRADRLKEFLISSKKEVFKNDKGYSEVVHTSNQDKEKAVVALKDNGAGIMASN